MHLSMCQPVKAVMHRQHVVTLDETHPHGRADGSIHTSTGGTNVDDGYVDVALVARREIYLVYFKSGKKSIKSYAKIYKDIQRSLPLHQVG